MYWEQDSGDAPAASQSRHNAGGAGVKPCTFAPKGAFLVDSDRSASLYCHRKRALQLEWFAFAQRKEAHTGVLDECPEHLCPGKMRGVTVRSSGTTVVVVTGVHVVGVRKEHLI